MDTLEVSVKIVALQNAAGRSMPRLNFKGEING